MLGKLFSLRYVVTWVHVNAVKNNTTLEKNDGSIGEFTFDVEQVLPYWANNERNRLLKSSTLKKLVYDLTWFHKAHFSVRMVLSNSFPSWNQPTHSRILLTVCGICVQNTEKQMRQLAVIPPMLFDAEQQRIKFINMNGLMDDPLKVYKDRQVMNMWSEQEKDTFREK